MKHDKKNSQFNAHLNLIFTLSLGNSLNLIKERFLSFSLLDISL